MTIRNYELNSLVSLGDVLEAIEWNTERGTGSHDIDLGDAGFVTVDCESSVRVDIEAVEHELARRVRS